MDIGDLINNDEEVYNASNRYGHYFYTYTKKFHYKSFNSVYQKGPTCGLTALGMYLGLDFNGIELLLNDARGLEYTKSGEMFSALNMYKLTKSLIDKKVELYTGYLHCDEIIDFLLNGGVMLVPYDTDANYEPTLRNGHKAHWALVSGVIVCQGDNVFVMAKQGKSKTLGIWSLSLLAASNAQLLEVSPQKTNPDEYVIPEEGITGENGLCNKAILMHPS